MICGQLKELLMQVALDDASAEERARVEAHMASCGACRQVFAEWKLTRKLVAQGLPQEEPPQRIRFAPARPAPAFGAWLWQRAFAIPVGAAAAIAILIAALALSGARVTVTQGRWEVAFGRPAAASPAGRGAMPASAQLFTREQVAELVSEAVRQSEQRQHADTVQFVEKTVGAADQRQQAALRDVAMQMNYFERTQNLFYKQNEGTLYALQSLEKRLPGDREGRP